MAASANRKAKASALKKEPPRPGEVGGRAGGKGVMASRKTWARLGKRSQSSLKEVGEEVAGLGGLS
jgi:hypothetical protein